MARILVADDEVGVCRAMGRVFKQLGWHAIEVTDAVTIVDSVRRHRPDVVLLDVAMPGVDGFGILTAIRSDADVARTPVVMYSALDDEDTVDRALEMGADDYIIKGTSLNQICERVSLYVPARRGCDGRCSDASQN